MTDKSTGKLTHASSYTIGVVRKSMESELTRKHWLKKSRAYQRLGRRKSQELIKDSAIAWMITRARKQHDNLDPVAKASKNTTQVGTKAPIRYRLTFYALRKCGAWSTFEGRGNGMRNPFLKTAGLYSSSTDSCIIRLFL